MKKSRFYVLCLALIVAITPLSAQEIAYSVKKIWGDGTSHCAFTSLIHYKGNYYCTFREGASHIFDKEGKAEGKIRILSSPDGETWESVALVGKDGCDFRDPKLSIMPDGRMLVNFVASIYRDRKIQSRHPYVMFSTDGKTYTEPEMAKLDKKLTSNLDWIWRVTWHDKTGYAVSYNKSSKGDKKYTEAWLLKTKDGKRYNVVTQLDIDNFPNEATIRFLPDGRMVCMIRRERGDRQGLFGISEAPYKEWTWKKMGFQLGGQDFLYLNDDRIIMCSRSYAIKKAWKTCVYKGKNNGRFEEILVLPSGGDCSYPGMLIVGDELWISYYSTHATRRAAIYLAKIPLKTLEAL